MSAGKYSFTIEQGATLNIPLQWSDGDGNPVDLSGYSARMQIRPNATSDKVYVSLSSVMGLDGSGINLSGSNGSTPLSSGSMAICISAYSSSLLTFSDAVYDLEMVYSDTVTRLIEGNIRLSKNVTR
jgi:hypothetical protein